MAKAETALIAGCGIAGPVAALVLKRLNVESVIYEAWDEGADRGGLFLGLSPNGMNVLKSLGLHDDVERAGFECHVARLFNSRGRLLAEVDMGANARRFGVRSVMISRAVLHRVLREAAIQRGIAVKFGKRVESVADACGPRPILRFADKTEASADIVLGCDGIHSRVRAALVPGIGPRYTGVVGVGGITRAARTDLPAGVLHLTFGKRTFFGYGVDLEGRVLWFSNMSWPDEPSRAELAAITPEQWQLRLLDLHSDDPHPIPQILRDEQAELMAIPIHDMPPLPAWHCGPVALVGDAAHATSPHGGQGASMALEDALMLGRCLAEEVDSEIAFARYQALRKPRVDRLVAQARRRGQERTMSNPLALWLRDRLLPLMIRFETRSMDWVYGYRVDAELKERAA